MEDDHSAERDRQARKSRKIYEKAAEVGYIPHIGNKRRRNRARLDLLFFLQKYFPNSTGMSPFCQAQIDAVKRIEIAILEEGWVTNIMPRGFIKSTIGENATLWGMLFGHISYALFFAGTASLASKAVKSIYSELVTNELLLEDFPEICIPFQKLGGKSQGCASQTHQGTLTRIEWTREHLVFPNIPGAAGAGAVLESYGLLSPPRGARKKTADGKNVRPDFVVLDDPQTDASAKSPTQTASRLDYIYNSILMLGGHGHEVSAVMNATIIRENDLADQLSDYNKNPEWQSVRVPMVQQMPRHLEDMWLTQYAEIRRNYDRTDPRGRIKSLEASTKFYRKHRKKMDLGSICSWKNIGLSKTEISALQHAMNILIDKGEKTFYAECQNAPLRPQVASALDLSREDLEGRINHYDRGVIPDGRSHVVFHVDVHDEVLYWTVAAVSQDFTGDVIAYGTWPEQPVPWFTLRAAKLKLSDIYPGRENDQAIEEGVTDCLSRLLAAEWRFSDGTRMEVSVGLVDAGYKMTPVANAIRRIGNQSIVTSQGIGIGPVEKPMPEYDMSSKRVLRCGPEPNRPRWYFPREHIQGDVLRVHFDTNFWKSEAVSRLKQRADAGAWRKFGNQRIDHAPYDEHLLAERPEQVTAKGRTVNVFRVVQHQDNHWLDTFVGCLVAASIAGCRLPVDAGEFQDDLQPAPKPSIQVDLPAMPDGRDFFITAR